MGLAVQTVSPIGDVGLFDLNGVALGLIVQPAGIGGEGALEDSLLIAGNTNPDLLDALGSLETGIDGVFAFGVFGESFDELREVPLRVDHGDSELRVAGGLGGIRARRSVDPVPRSLGQNQSYGNTRYDDGSNYKKNPLQTSAPLTRLTKF